jgi:hypothetical protein
MPVNPMKAKTSPKNPARWHRTILTVTMLSVFILIVPAISHAQSCQNSTDLDDATRSAIAAAGKRDFDLAAKGDTASLRQNAIATLASDFSHTEALVKDKQTELADAQATARPFFLLEVEGAAAIPNAEFYCGVFGKNGQTSGSAVFSLQNLAPGKYVVILFDATSPKARNNFSMILQQVGTDWKLADLYIEPAQIAGHDSEWFAARAREYKTKSQMHNAWLYYLQARSLISPLPFMATLATDKLYEEFQTLQPSDIPSNAKPVDLTVGAVTYKLTALFSAPVGSDLDLVVRYQIADASNTTQAYQTNLAVAKALIAKYPEVKDAFAAVVARAVDASGHDFGTPLEMKDAK